jgi:dolichol kinase
VSGPAPHEVQRRLLHLASGSLALAVFLPPLTVVLLLAVLVALACGLEVWRRRAARAARASFSAGVEGMFRPAERAAVSGATLLAVGYLAAWLVAPGAAAARATIVAAAADPTAAAVGTRVAPAAGRKTWAGTLGAFVAAVAVLLATGLSAPHALAGAAAAAAAERLSWRGADNIAIPVATAAVLRLLG